MYIFKGFGEILVCSQEMSSVPCLVCELGHRWSVLLSLPMSGFCRDTFLSFSGDIQDLPGQGPLQPAVGDPASAGVLDWVTHRGPFQPRPFCDSVILSLLLDAKHYPASGCLKILEETTRDRSEWLRTRSQAREVLRSLLTAYRREACQGGGGGPAQSH